MTTSLKLLKTLDWTIHSVRFFKTHFLTIFGLGLIAALGRAIQLGAFGQITALTNIVLEVVIESVRILIFLYTLGLTNIKTGVARIGKLFTDKHSRRQNWRLAIQKTRAKWVSIVVNLIAFLAITFLINYLINHIAYETCMYAKLKADRIISQQASVWALILFFKNISVIPFTLTFEAIFLLWIVNRLPRSLTYNQGMQ